MDSQYLRFGLEQFLIRRFRYVQQCRLGIRCPTRITVAVCHFVTSQREGLLYRPFQVVLALLDRRTLRGIHLDIRSAIHGRFLAHLDRGEVRTGLHQSRHLFAHGDHAVRTLAERQDETVRLIGRHIQLRQVAGLQLHAHIFLHFTKHAFHLSHILVPFDTYLLLVRHRNADDSLGLTGNSVAQVTTVDTGQLHLRLGPYTGQEEDEQLVGIRTALVDIITRVTTHQSRHRQTDTEG